MCTVKTANSEGVRAAKREREKVEKVKVFEVFAR